MDSQSWQCRLGHEWESTISNRNQGFGCPICSNKKVLQGHNDLATTNPELAREWHPTKNGDLTSDMVTAGMGKKVWWRCGHGHAWKSTLGSRNRGSGCPICANQQVLKGCNDLATTNPELLREWHPIRNKNLTPEMVAAGSNKKAWWQCDRGHEWETQICDRTNGSGCPVCAKELRTSFPEQAIFYYVKKVFKTTVNSYKLDNKSEIDVYIEELNLGIEYDGAWWHKDPEKDKEKNLFCKNNNIELIRIREKGCPTLDDGTYCIVLENTQVAELEKAINGVFTYITKNITQTNYSIGVDISKDTHHINELFVQSNKQDSLLAMNPELAINWHPVKNGKLTPEMVFTGSQKKVWWQCSHGHEWQATIVHRSQGTGCPVCAGRQVQKGFNDLETANPKLAQEWHPTKNGELTPKMVTANSNKKAWWRGECEHEWESSIGSRNQGNGCPICANLHVQKGYNDLETTNPKLAQEWHPTKNGKLTSEMLTLGSNKKIWWRCGLGHEWEASVSNRNNGRGCPICSNKQLLRGYNDLATSNPQLAKEWHPTKNGDLTPEMVSAGMGKKVWWQCRLGHEWESAIADRHLGIGCPICSNKQLLRGYNDLATSNPQLVKEWHPTKNGDLTPEMVSAGMGKKVWWQCDRGHEWESVIGSRSRGSGCPICANQKVLIGYNDLAATNPELAMDWHPTMNGSLTPEMLTSGSGNKVWWQCNRGHDWLASVDARNNKGSGCPICSNKQVLRGYNDLATANPQLAKEWHPTKNGELTPEMVTACSNKKVWWKCGRGHEWQISIASRSKGRNCPVCRKEKQLAIGEMVSGVGGE